MQGIVLQKKSENLCKCCKPSVVGYLNVEDGTPQVKKGNESGSFRNYAYEPETDVIELHSPKVDKLISQL